RNAPLGPWTNGPGPHSRWKTREVSSRPQGGRGHRSVRGGIAGREEEGMADWLLEIIGGVGAIGFDSESQRFDLLQVAPGGEPMPKPRGLSARRLKAVPGYIHEHPDAALTLRDLAA